MDEAQADFTLNLLRTTADLQKSVILSPFSVAVALTMTYIGAGGQTEEQMLDVLSKGNNASEISSYFSSLLTEISNEKKNYILDIANRLYIRQDCQLKRAYLDLIQTHFVGQLEKVDFDQKDTVVKEINNWVMHKTRDKIKNFISPDNINSNTKLLLINAIYFKDNWAKIFNKVMTRTKTFHGERSRQVEMMTTEGSFPFYEDNLVQILGIPYSSRQIYMFIILPKEHLGLSNVEKELTGRKLFDYIQKCTEREVQLEMPKFKLEQKVELKSSLQTMGMKDAFTYAANFTGISDESLYISAVLHQSYIEVNEEGTKASAASGIELRLRSAPIILSPKIIFRADHPYLFFIIRNSRVILFSGRVL
ncbi:unnamed protein product [Thelazia callipaeda]|uniref:SERPIN domain-containing protein n=1 Tax=Thelazia callipaeda TaxID=103827 RepID=A0A0N5D329_THECL|nr:unnamed protein product [Thelazia callipaeda]